MMSTKPTWLQQAIELFTQEGFKDGDIISLMWLHHALDLKEPRTLAEVEECSWVKLTRLKAFQDWLLEDKQIALENIRGEGYRIVPPREQAEVAARKAMKGVKKSLTECSRTITHTRMSLLTPDEKRRHTDAHIRLIGVGEIMSRQRKDIFGLFGPKN